MVVGVFPHVTGDIEQKAKFGQKKLALNTTNKQTFLSWVNIFSSTGMVTILNAGFSMANYCPLP